jgi:hypothetical protein
VKIAIKSINKKTNLLRRPEAKKLSQEQFKGVKNHNLNSDFSLLNTKTQENILLDKTKHLLFDGTNENEENK